MADERGFLKFPRIDPPKRPANVRTGDFRSVQKSLPIVELGTQAARCMDCGVPFCQNNCPLGNIIPDFNDLVYRDDWQGALERLHSTNNFPEFTGLVCPAPCESGCVLGINDDPVTIKQVEHAIVSRGWQEGWITPQPSDQKTGRRVAIIGSGPAGLAASQELARLGHAVDVFEKNDRIGGLLRYGIPDFKLEKHVIDRRLAQLEAEGVTFHCGVEIGKDKTLQELQSSHDAVLFAIGSENPRDLPIPGRELDGIHFAMTFLSQQNRVVAGEHLEDQLSAADLDVVVIGGGDTGSDCVGTAHRQGARSVTSVELLPEPPKDRHYSEPWPRPTRYLLRTTSSHEEGGNRLFALETVEFLGEGHVTGLRVAQVSFDTDDQKRPLLGSRVRGPSTILKADLVLLAMGFVGPTLESIDGVPTTQRGTLDADTKSYMTEVEGIFAAGDCRKGQSLVVWAQQEGRDAAKAVHKYLKSKAPNKDVCKVA